MQYVLCTSLEKSPQTNPIIGRIECKAGHGAGRPTQKMVIYYICSPEIVTFHLLLIVSGPGRVLFEFFRSSVCEKKRNCELRGWIIFVQIDEAADRYGFMAKMVCASWLE